MTLPARRLLLSTRIPTLQARTEKIGVQVIEHADVDGSMLITSAAGSVRVYFPEEYQSVEARCARCSWGYDVPAPMVSGPEMDAMLGQIIDHLAAHVAAIT